jgi:protoporphyrinogen oxidase
MVGLTILGGGPAGLAVAYYAHRAGLPFVLFEAADETGGMCRTLACGEHLYDLGAHRFHDRDPEVTRDVVALMGADLLRVDAPSAIWDRGRFIDFPPTPLNAMFAYGPRVAARIALDLLRSGARRRRPAATFEDFAVRRFGETLARRILLDYSAKLWGVPTGQLSPDVATRRLQGMTLRTLLYELVFPGGKGKTRHIDGTFLYPRRGYGQIVETLVRTLPRDSIRTGHRVERLECQGGSLKRIHFAGGSRHDVDGRVISTLPLPRLVTMLGDAAGAPAVTAASRLRFRHVRLLFLRLSRPRLSDKASIYIPDPAFCVSRISEPRNRSASMAPKGETAVVVEAPFFAGDAVGRLSAVEFAGRIVGELAALRLLDPRDVLESREHLLANAYPVYENGYGPNVQAVLESIEGIENLDTLGRAGRFVYSHLHDQLRFGRDYVRNIFAGFEEGSVSA